MENKIHKLLYFIRKYFAEILAISLLSVCCWQAVRSCNDRLNRHDVPAKHLSCAIYEYVNIDVFRSKYDIPHSFSPRLIKYTYYTALSYDIPVHIAFNLLHEESRFRWVDNGLCGGYMQLNHKYFKWSSKRENIKLGLQFLREKYDELGTWSSAVIFYNSGNHMNSRKEYVNYILYHSR